MAASKPAQQRNPYVGPRPFERNDRELFYGREVEAQSLTLMVVANRTLLVYAQSGAGKTSLLNARVIPLLEERGFEVLPVARVSGLNIDSSKLPDQANVYGVNALISLAGDEVSIESLSRQTLSVYLGERQRLTDEDGFTLPRVLIFDQLEELFTAYPQYWREREGFFKQVEEARRQDAELHVVFTMREDYIARLDPYTASFDNRLNDRFRLDLLEEKGALEAVRRPLVGTGVEFAPGVAEQLVNDLLQIRVESETGETIVEPGEHVEPVQLQIVCQGLWNELPPGTKTITATSLSQFGNVNQALTNYYRSALKTAVEKTKVKEAELRAWFEKNLITPAGTRGIVYQGREETGGISNPVIEVLEDLYIIRPERRAGARWYELTHDRLIEPILADNRTVQITSYKKAVERERRSTLRQLVIVLAFLAGSFLLLAAALIGYITVSYNDVAARYGSAIAALVNYSSAGLPPVRILDANGGLLTEVNRGVHQNVSLSEMSPELVYAIIGTHDPLYYSRPAFDPINIATTFIQHLQTGEIVSGSRTIPQQLADMVIANQGTPAERKLHEIVIASEIARQYDKNFVLELFLNEVYLGNRAYGVQAASELYFDKDAKELNLVESAMLAGLLRAPSANPATGDRYTAFSNTDNALYQLADVGCLAFQYSQFAGGPPFCIERSRILRDNGDFTATMNLERAQLQTRQYLPPALSDRYPHFIQYVSDLLQTQYGDQIFRDGFVVRTTLVPEIQDLAERALRDQIHAQGFTGLQTGAVMVTDPTTGALLAMVGSPDFNDPAIDGQINYGFTWQQPGATIMPIVYMAALEGADRNVNGAIESNEYMTPATILWDVPTQFQEPLYQPVNDDGQFRGPVSLRSALANSLNVPAVKAYNFVGDARFVDTAYRFGLRFLDASPSVGLPTAVGATEVRLIDMMQAYGVLANDGQLAPLRAIDHITNALGNDVALSEIPPVQRLQPSLVFLVQNILSDNNARAQSFGLNSPLSIPELADGIAAKSGTSQDGRDLWTIGFSRNVVVGVWLGRPDNAPTLASALQTAAPLWNQIIRAAMEDRPMPASFASPGNLIQGNVDLRTICALTGTIADAVCRVRRNEWFSADRPALPADQGMTIILPLDTWTGLRANEFCPENIENHHFVHLEDPSAIQWLASPAGQVVAQQLALPLPPLPPPTNACDAQTVLPIARVINPSDSNTVQGVVQIIGTILADNFNRYQLEIAPIDTATYQIIAGPFQTQQPAAGALLAEWDTTTVPNGAYTLRLMVFSNDGGYLVRQVRVLVTNPLSLVTPAPTFTPGFVPTFDPPTQTPVSFATFEPVLVPSQSFSQPTPTATISLGG